MFEVPHHGVAAPQLSGPTVPLMVVAHTAIPDHGQHEGKYPLGVRVQGSYIRKKFGGLYIYIYIQYIYISGFDMNTVNMLYILENKSPVCEGCISSSVPVSMEVRGTKEITKRRPFTSH
jgi:hypothetical protein